MQVINDSIGESPETVILAIVGNPSAYDVRYNFATVTITDDGDVPSATVTATRPSAYELGRPGIFTFNLSNPNAVDTTVKYNITGTATNGVDYVTITNVITFPAGTTNATLTITPIDNSKLDGNRTVILTVTNGTGYTVGSVSNATDAGSR